MSYTASRPDFLTKKEALTSAINNKMRSLTYFTYGSDITPKMLWKKSPFTSTTSPNIKGLKSLEKKVHVPPFPHPTFTEAT